MVYYIRSDDPSVLGDRREPLDKYISTLRKLAESMSTEEVEDMCEKLTQGTWAHVSEMACQDALAEAEVLRARLEIAKASKAVAWAQGRFDLATEGIGDEEMARAELEKATADLAKLQAEFPFEEPEEDDLQPM